MDEQNTDVNSIFKDQVVRQMDRISSISISTKEEPVHIAFLQDGGFMIKGSAYIDFMFRDPDKMKDRFFFFLPDKIIDAEEDGDDDE